MKIQLILFFSNLTYVSFSLPYNADMMNWYTKGLTMYRIMELKDNVRFLWALWSNSYSWIVRRGIKHIIHNFVLCYMCLILWQTSSSYNVLRSWRTNTYFYDCISLCSVRRIWFFFSLSFTIWLMVLITFYLSEIVIIILNFEISKD